MPRLLHILFWSVISAAFIGPGTVTTAASAGAHFGYDLLWAVLFSTAACLVLQEASARLTIVSGHNLGEALRLHFRSGLTGLVVTLIVVGAVIVGCAAYEAGNILGGVAGAALGTQASPALLTVICVLAAALMLWFGTASKLARLLGLVVAAMGIAFLLAAVLLRPPVGAVISASLVPALPPASGLLVVALVGTTVVPYNLFLGSGLARGSSLPDMRFGLSVAVVLGGFFTMCIVIVGAAVEGPFSFAAVAAALASQLGEWAALFFAFGLFAAGFSSAITAPLAAAITAQSLFGKRQPEKWQERARYYRATWLLVLGTGLIFGLSGVRPIPIIILAQAFNGVLLPLVAIFLFVVVNNPILMGRDGINSRAMNAAMGIVVLLTLVLGVANVMKAGAAAFGLASPDELLYLRIAGVLSLLIAVPLFRAIRKARALV